ncbi:putative spermatogenesis-associated protein 31C1 [Chionomys nivalis]|uniref:putative spermatogenesis-associated protein 31C1 n=1 Tax=Chionomys nivalis TaxID=269649 RepID=UPI0025953602|nr:putative spermatogenesis-associated protein 31C1 [Chionomys nivalis]
MQPQLRKNVAKNLSQILGRCLLDNPQVISECYVLNNLSAVPKKEQNCACHSRTGLECQQFIIRKSLDHRQTRSILRSHMNIKLRQITMGRIPLQVCCSWLAEDLPPWNALRNVSCNTTIPSIPFLNHKIQKVLETHLIRFRMSQKWDLPLKVIESIKCYMLREAKTWPLPQSDCPSHSNSTSELDLKNTSPPPLRGSSNLFHEDKTERASANSASIIDQLPLSIPHVDGEGGEPLRQSHSSPAYEVTETVQTAEGDRPSNVDSTSQDDAEPHSRPRQEPPVKDQVAESESKNEMASSSSHPEIPKGDQKVERNPMYKIIRSMLNEILRALEVSTLLLGSASSGKLHRGG